jgi:hypothetical protein
MVQAPMSGARDETIRKKQAKGVAARVARSFRGLGIGPSGPGRRSRGAADLPNECPFGAERGAERAARREIGVTRRHCCAKTRTTTSFCPCRWIDVGWLWTVVE